MAAVLLNTALICSHGSANRFCISAFDADGLVAELVDRTGDSEPNDSMLELYARCNRVTLDEPGSALTAAGF
jgi:hypothetical protein